MTLTKIGLNLSLLRVHHVSNHPHPYIRRRCPEMTRVIGHLFDKILTLHSALYRERLCCKFRTMVRFFQKVYRSGLCSGVPSPHVLGSMNQTSGESCSHICSLCARRCLQSVVQ